MLQDGARRLQQVAIIPCGELSAADLAKQWVAVDSTEPKDIRFQAGVYKSGDRMLAVNRPASEDDPEVVDSSEMKKLFGDLPMRMFEDRQVDTNQLEGEIWRLFLFLMLLFVLVEGYLILPANQSKAQPA
jgi:hypothetical protein